jgi:hypothetical protein
MNSDFKPMHSDFSVMSSLAGARLQVTLVILNENHKSQVTLTRPFSSVQFWKWGLTADSSTELKRLRPFNQG